MDVRLAWTECDDAGDYLVPNVLSQRDLASRPGKMEETVLHTFSEHYSYNKVIFPDTVSTKLR